MSKDTTEENLLTYLNLPILIYFKAFKSLLFVDDCVPLKCLGHTTSTDHNSQTFLLDFYVQFKWDIFWNWNNGYHLK